MSIFLLRVWYLFKITPPVLNQDESAILLNARFIAQSGVDEYGVKYPVVFPSFGDAKLPGYIYTTAVLWKFIPHDFVVRLPAFFAGIATVLLSGFIVSYLTQKKGAGLATVLFMLISPWGYHFGTIGFEAQMGLALFLASIAVLLVKPTQVWRDVLGSLFLFLACITYNAPLLLAPAIVVGLAVWREKRKETLRLVVFYLIALVAAAVLTLSASAQKTGIAFIQDANVIAEYPVYREQFAGISQRVFGNKWVYFFGIFIKNITDSFSWEFLVLRGGSNPWHGIPRTGHLHFMIPLLAAMGVGSFLKLVWNAVTRRMWKTVLFLTVLFGIGATSLLPAAITVDAPHATRSLFFFICITGLAGWQFSALYERACSLVPQKFFAIIRLALSGLFVSGYMLWWWMAPYNWNQYRDAHWYSGLEEALAFVDTTKYDRIYIEDPEGVLYTRVANYENMQSNTFLSSVRRSAPAPTGLMRGEQLGKYIFVYQRSDAQAGGLYLEQKSNKEWGTIEL